MNKEQYKTSDGEELVEVVEYRKYADVTARIVGTDYTVNTTMGAVKKGIKNPFTNHSPIGFETPDYAALGSIYTTNEGYHIKIIGYQGCANVTYQFLDAEKSYTGKTTMQNIRNGEVRNPFRSTAFGGYLGSDQTYRHDEYGWLYQNWTNMLIRGHEANKEYYNQHRPDTHIYDNTMVDPEWLNYSNYASWYMDQYSRLNHSTGTEYVVDKDLLYRFYWMKTDGKKCYGPNTCVLIPKALNNAISANTDVSKAIMNTTGQTYLLSPDHPIKIMAKQYFKFNCITKRVYDALMLL